MLVHTQIDITIDKLLILKKEYSMAVHKDGDLGEMISGIERDRLDRALRDIQTSLGILTQHMHDACRNKRYE